MKLKMKMLCALVLPGMMTACLPSVSARADSLGGPYAIRSGALGARASKYYSITFRAGETARVSAAGTGDVDLVIFDEDGDRVEWDTLRDRTPLCEWTPAYTQTYTVEVKNCDNRSVYFDLDSN